MSLANLASFRDLTKVNLRIDDTAEAWDACNANDTLIACDWSFGLTGNIIANLFLVFLVRFLLTPFIITLPIPVGLFFPCAIVGAAFGRMWGEILWEIVKAINGSVGTSVYVFDSLLHPGAYALVGAAAFTSGYTQTVSPAIIMLELTQQLRLLYPVMFSTIPAIIIFRRFMPSIYDSLAFLNGLKYMPDLKYYDSAWTDTVGAIMTPLEVDRDDGVTTSSAATSESSSVSSISSSDSSATVKLKKKKSARKEEKLERDSMNRKASVKEAGLYISQNMSQHFDSGMG
jgi:hypothetical protein